MPKRKINCRFCKKRGHNIMQCDDPGIQSTIDRLEVALETFYVRDELVEHLTTYNDDEIAVLSCRHNNQLSRIPREEQVDTLILIYTRRQKSGRIQASEYLNRIQRTYPDEPLSIAIYMYFKTKIDRWINYENRDETFVYLAINMNCEVLHDKVAEIFVDDVKCGWEQARTYSYLLFERKRLNLPVWTINTILEPICDSDTELVSDTEDENTIGDKSHTCPICLNDHETNADFVKTNCQHQFCVGCMETYLDRSSKIQRPVCPMCRTEISQMTLYMIDHLTNYQEKYGPSVNIPDGR